ncbi:hypothetical protein GCM10027446_07040 [Angustibacter peucedani]
MTEGDVPGAVVEPLRHHTGNGVTGGVDRLTWPDGSRLVRKRLLPPGARTSRPGWAAGAEPQHWNSWRREELALTSPDLAAALVGTGLRTAGLVQVEPGADGSTTLWLRDEPGRTAGALDLDDHRRVAHGLGRWQGGWTTSGAPLPGWTSRGFLRAYPAAHDVRWDLLEDDTAWDAPLVRAHLPRGLRAGWQRLVAHRERLTALVEGCPRTWCHLDAWPANVVVPPAEARHPDVVLLDLAFTGDGALGEDVGNWVPDTFLDLLQPVDRLDDVERVAQAAYLEGLAAAGWTGDERLVRLAVTASAVKYAWLLPLVLERAHDAEHRAYGEVVDAEQLHAARGVVLDRLVSWADEAPALATALGR